MIPILTKEQAYQLDKSSIESGYISEAELMDNAGFSIACHILENFPNPFQLNIGIVVGKGNNGGDGIIVHQYLTEWNCNSQIILANDDIRNSKLIRKYGIADTDILDYSEDLDFAKYDLIIDGILGIGNSRKINGIYLDIIDKINLCENVISIDIPSGLLSNNGMMKEISVFARQTHIMGFPKLAHFLNDGLTTVGELQIHDIGFPDFEPVIFSLIEEQDIRENIILPNPNVHKYSKGKLVVIGGSEKYIGAMELTSIAGYRAGAGYVKAIVPKEIQSSINRKYPEIITDEFTPENLRNGIDWADAVVVGPGLNLNEEELNLIVDNIKEFKIPVVIDASILQLINPEFPIQNFPEQTIFTPHTGELKNMSYNIQADFVQEPNQYCDELIDELDGRYCLIKGQPNFLVNPDGTIYLMNHGSPMLATAGTGDVLSGLIGGLLAQGYDEKKAMQIGSWIHAETALIFAENFGSQGMIASDLLDFIPSAFEKYVS